MAPSILMRDVPQPVHQVLLQRAEASGQSLQKYLLEIVTDIASRPTVSEIMATVAESLPSDGMGSVTHEEIIDSIRQGRKEREERTW